MFIDIIPLQKNTARLTRVYGDAPCAALPASVPGPEGGVLAITELGDYCFSEKPRSLPGADALCRYEVSPDGTCTLVQAFGRDLTGRHGRYDLDFGEEAAAPEELHPVCGNFVEEIILPDSLQVIGSCAFYNCPAMPYTPASPLHTMATVLPDRASSSAMRQRSSSRVMGVWQTSLSGPLLRKRPACSPL